MESTKSQPSQKAWDATLRALDLLIATGHRHQGFFPSILNLDGTQPFRLPDAIPGQRNCDRAFPGTNLMHDHALLRVLRDIDAFAPGHGFAVGADRYLTRFAAICSSATSGLFPWGEHLFWNLEEDRIGSSYALERVATMATHDHLLQAPQWLWEDLWARNPNAVERFALGLERHFLDVDGTSEYNRHASALVHYLKRTRGERSCDFPRHSGFFAFDWAFISAATGSHRFAHNVLRAMDYWWERRPASGPLSEESRGAGRKNIVGSQTMSLGVSLLETADLLKERQPEIAVEARRRGWHYINAFLLMPHELQPGRFIDMYHADDGKILIHLRNWGNVYGQGVLSTTYALLALRAYAFEPREDLIAFASAVGRSAAAEAAEALKKDDTSVRDAGQYLSLLLELHVITADPQWMAWWRRDAAAAADMFLDAGLPRIAVGRTHYESQQLPGHSLRALARGHLLETAGVDIGGDFTLR